MKKETSFTKIAYWVISSFVLFIPTYHYMRVFVLFEHNTDFGIILSWMMGIVFDGTCLIFLYHFNKIKSAFWKYFIMFILIGFIFFLHFMYYALTVKNIFLRCGLSAVWPFLVFVIAYLGQKVLIEAGKKEDTKEVIETDQGTGYDQFTFLNSPKKKTKKRRPNVNRKVITIQDCWSEEKGCYVCPGCELEGSRARLNGHRWRECLKKKENENE